MFVQFCSQNLPSFEPFLGFFWPWFSLGPLGTSFILSLVPLSSPSPSSRIVCLSVCLSLDCLSSDCVLCACFETKFRFLDFLIFISLCVWLDGSGERKEGRKDGRKEGGELGLLCRWKNSSAAGGVFGDLKIFYCLLLQSLLKFQLPVIIRRSFCSSLSRLLCDLLMMLFFWVFWVLGLDELWSSSSRNRCCFAAQFAITFKYKTFKSFGDDGWWGAECTDDSSSSSCL